MFSGIFCKLSMQISGQSPIKIIPQLSSNKSIVTFHGVNKYIMFCQCWYTCSQRSIFHYLDTLKNDSHPALYNANYSLLSFLSPWLFRRKAKQTSKSLSFLLHLNGGKLTHLENSQKIPCRRFVPIWGEHPSFRISAIQVMSSLYKV